jgi:hypothetical protein
MLVRELVCGEAADHRLGERARIQALKIGSGLLDEAKAHLVRHDLPVEQPFLGFGDRERLGQHVVHLDDLDAAVAHLGHEVEMVTLGVLHLRPALN